MIPSFVVALLALALVLPAIALPHDTPTYDIYNGTALVELPKRKHIPCDLVTYV